MFKHNKAFFFLSIVECIEMYVEGFFFFLLLRFQNLTISIWTWMELFTSAPTPMMRMSTFAYLRKRYLQTSFITWRCSLGSSSLVRSSSWRWMVLHQGQRWTNREDGDSGKAKEGLGEILSSFYVTGWLPECINSGHLHGSYPEFMFVSVWLCYQRWNTSSCNSHNSIKMSACYRMVRF